MYVPLIAKRLSNGFASVVTIQDISSSNTATVSLTYNPSPIECPVAICDTNSDTVVDENDALVISGLTIDPLGSIMRNHRVPGAADNSEPTMPDDGRNH